MLENKQRFTLDCKVDSYRAGWTVVDFLSHRFPYHPPERWTHRVSDGRVLVNGARVAPEAVVRERDVVTYSFLHNEPPVDFRYDVVHEDGDLLVVSKSGNLPVHACGVYIKSTLITHIKNAYGDHVNLAHRLDRETSGLVVMSKNRAAARALGRMFAEGQVAKSYLAVVHGRVDHDEFTVDAPIARSEAIAAIDRQRETMRGLSSELREDFPNFVPKRVVDFAKGKPAVTCFQVMRRGDGFTVLEARPQSGRTNQIRVHLHHVGYPIVGDKVYGVGVRVGVKDGGASNEVVERTSAGVPTLDRHALHCYSLEFDHPVTGQRLRPVAPVPEDLQFAQS